MPTYEYRCNSCGYDFEAVQKFEDEPLTVCPKCGSELRKVFNSVGIVFKGSGFYSTDNHSASKPAASSAPETHTDTSGTAPAPSPAAVEAPEAKPKATPE